MNRLFLLSSFSLLAAGGPLHGQAAADTARTARMHRVEGRLREMLGLSAEQATKLQATMQHFREQRRAIGERQRALGLALRGQLQPGVAANADSVRKLLDARDQNETALAQLRRDARREMAGYLTPVQQARLEVMRERMAGRFARMRGRHGRGWGRTAAHRWFGGGSEWR